MQFRFLYLDGSGAETKVSSLDELAEKFRAGEIHEDTVLYDALTREWGPAAVHGVWRELHAADDPPVLAVDPRAGTPPATELTLAPDFLEDEGAVAAFVAARERERREEAQRRGTTLPEPQIVREQPGSGLGHGAPGGGGHGGGRRERRPNEGAPPQGAPREPRAPVVGGAVASGSSVVRGSAGGRATPPRPWVRDLLRGGALLSLVAVLVIAWAWAGRSGEADADGLPAADLTPPSAPAPVDDARLAGVLDEAEGSAFEAMVVALDSLRAVFGVVTPPEGWLDGHYLAHASEYPSVPAYWDRYGRYVDELRERDAEFFRQSYVSRLNAAGMTGPVASIRLARAMEDFNASAPARDSVYTAMREVAQAALDLHILLLERERDITWTPVRPGYVTTDPVLEAVPDDEALRREVNERLDELLDAMDRVRGGLPGSGAELGAAALTSLRGTRPGSEATAGDGGSPRR